MSVLFLVITLLFIVISATMILIILVQRPQGGGLVGAFGGAGAGGTETVFGGRVGDALTWATVGAFVLYLGVAITLNKIDSSGTVAAAQDTAQETEGASPEPTPQLTPQLDPASGGGIRMREPTEDDDFTAEDAQRLIDEYMRQQQQQRGEQP